MAQKKILMVNEDRVVATILQNVLTIDSYTFELAHNFEDVDILLENNVYDLVLTDLAIDGLFSNEYILYLKNKLPKAPLFIMSAMDQLGIKQEMLQLGVDVFISIPLDLDKLKNELNKNL